MTDSFIPTTLELPDHIDLEIAGAAEINRYIHALNLIHQKLDQRFPGEVNDINEAQHRYDLAKLYAECVNKKTISQDAYFELQKAVVDAKKELGDVKNQHACSKRASASITEFRISALAALRTRRP